MSPYSTWLGSKSKSVSEIVSGKQPSRLPTDRLGDITDCAELIQALNDCHAKGMFHKLTGGCNGIKHDLNMCLRAEVSGVSRPRLLAAGCWLVAHPDP